MHQSSHRLTKINYWSNANLSCFFETGSLLWMKENGPLYLCSKGIKVKWFLVSPKERLYWFVLKGFNVWYFNRALHKIVKICCEVFLKQTQISVFPQISKIICKDKWLNLNFCKLTHLFFTLGAFICFCGTHLPLSGIEMSAWSDQIVMQKKTKQTLASFTLLFECGDPASIRRSSSSCVWMFQMWLNFTATLMYLQM